MKNRENARGRPSFREELEEAVRTTYKQATEEKTPGDDNYQANATMNPYMKAGIYVVAGFVIVWASQFAFAAVAGAIRQFKNLKRAIKE